MQLLRLPGAARVKMWGRLVLCCGIPCEFLWDVVKSYRTFLKIRICCIKMSFSLLHRWEEMNHFSKGRILLCHIRNRKYELYSILWCRLLYDPTYHCLSPGILEKFCWFYFIHFYFLSNLKIKNPNCANSLHHQLKTPHFASCDRSQSRCMHT